MSNYLLVCVIISFVFGLINGQPNSNNLCTNGECLMFPGNDTNNVVICTNKAKLCEIECIGQKACLYQNKVLTIYSGAKSTIIRCIGKDACIGIKVYLGSLSGKLLPRGWNANRFSGNKDSAYVNCDGEAACKHGSLQTTGVFSGDDACIMKKFMAQMWDQPKSVLVHNEEFQFLYKYTLNNVGGVLIKVTKPESFHEFKIQCLQDVGMCILECGYDACYRTSFYCYNDACFCNYNNDRPREHNYDFGYFIDTPEPIVYGPLCPKIFVRNKFDADTACLDKYATQNNNIDVLQSRVNSNENNNPSEIFTESDKYIIISEHKIRLIIGITIPTLVLFICLCVYVCVFKHNKCCKCNDDANKLAEYNLNELNNKYNTF